MSERYDSTAARHYAAFRPPLHGIILDFVIRPDESFPVGLDVGCGTGYSTVALAKYCDRVYGLDPSQSMLDVAQRNQKISYLCGSGDELDQLPVQRADIVTFAGSLFYAKSDRLRTGLSKVCPPGGTIIVYDFEVHLNRIVAKLGVNCPEYASGYDHYAGISDWAEFLSESNGTERISLTVSGSEMTHLLLADSSRYDAFSKHFSISDPFKALLEEVEKLDAPKQVEADIYYARYRVREH